MVVAALFACALGCNDTGIPRRSSSSGEVRPDPPRSVSTARQCDSHFDCPGSYCGFTGLGRSLLQIRFKSSRPRVRMLGITIHAPT